DGFDLGAVALCRKQKAGAHGLAAETHRARAANTVFAANMSAGQRKVVAEEIDQGLSRLDSCGNGLAVNAHADVEVVRAHPGPGGCCVVILIASAARHVMLDRPSCRSAADLLEPGVLASRSAAEARTDPVPNSLQNVIEELAIANRILGHENVL